MCRNYSCHLRHKGLFRLTPFSVSTSCTTAEPKESKRLKLRKSEFTFVFLEWLQSLAPLKHLLPELLPSPSSSLMEDNNGNTFHVRAP